MLTALNSNKKRVVAFETNKVDGPFFCSHCNQSLTLKKGEKKEHHFAHLSNSDCPHENESAEHMLIKTEIYKSLKKASNVTDCELEKSFGENRPDLFAVINGVKVAIEVQLSHLSVEKIQERTVSYHRKGIHVLWVGSYSRFLDRVDLDNGNTLTIKDWEKWVHTMYLGQMFLWKKESLLIPVKFIPVKNDKGYGLKKKRVAESKKPVFIEKDFIPVVKDAWRSYPKASIFNTYAIKKDFIYDSVVKDIKSVNLLKNEKSWFDKIIEFFFGSKGKDVCYS